MSTGTAPTQPQHGNATVSSISLSNGTVSNRSGLTISNLGNYYTTTATTNDVWSCYTNYMKPKSFKLR